MLIHAALSLSLFIASKPLDRQPLFEQWKMEHGKTYASPLSESIGMREYHKNVQIYEVITPPPLLPRRTL